MRTPLNARKLMVLGEEREDGERNQWQPTSLPLQPRLPLPTPFFLPLFLLATPASSDLPLTDAGATNLKAARQRSVDDHISGAWRAALRWPTCIFHPAAEIIRNS